MSFRVPSSRRVVRTPLSKAFAVSFLFFACLICYASPVHAALMVDNAAPHAMLWRRLYARMPAIWKTSELLNLREVSEEQMRRLAAEADGDERSNGDSVVDGMYQGTVDNPGMPATITLCPDIEGTDTDILFAHEYGHFVWETRLTRGQRARFRRIWNDQKRLGRLVTEYAGEDVDEGFAEAFAYYLCKPEDLSKSDQRAWNFLHDIHAAAGVLRPSSEEDRGGGASGR